ncbi:FAD-dependent monooxygenase [Actinoplanes sp. NPDC089786]|uniref:FAD-dependent monooxygenase n=1 Tax=Actinoplanes sp. NPDC089786 TaxID=3155185 RepID=UPI00343D28CD
MRSREVLISGAGVAGPLLAYWLGRHGLRPTIVERAPALRDGGYKVDVRGTAIEVLKRTGVYPAARARDTGMRQVTYVTPTGGKVAALDANLLMGRRGDDIEVMRGDLVRILAEAAAPVTEFRYGDAIASISPDGDVVFESGLERRFDVIVGADGLHSATRRLAGLDAPLRHLGAYLSIATVPNDLRLDREEVFWAVPGRMVFLYSTGPDEPAKAGMIFASPELSRSTVTRELVASKFAGDGWQVPRLLESILGEAPGPSSIPGEAPRASSILGEAPGASSILSGGAGPAATPTPALGGRQRSAAGPEISGAGDFFVDSLSQVDIPRWSAGRVVLLGDAAFCPSPASGQGTSTALCGAYVLARALARHGDTAAAFAEYEGTLRPYTERNLALGRKMAGQMVPGGRLSIAMRNYAMRTLRLNPWHKQIIASVNKPIFEAANALTLPDEELPAAAH